MNKLIVSLSPHVHGGDSVQKNMYGVLIALIPAFLVSLYFFGLGALIVTATSVAACLFFEWAIGKFLMKKETTTILKLSLNKRRIDKSTGMMWRCSVTRRSINWVSVL